VIAHTEKWFTDSIIDEADIFDLSGPTTYEVGFNKDDGFYSASENIETKIENNTYLLFLNYPYFDSIGKNVFVNNAPAHLYKLEQNTKMLKVII
jgi:hypothetical protein